ncbi:uncharacterized protein LOC122808648 isoform X2 [Protopterus annectens]|uniref:uncharacterized protein LOC122808648 isoform X2 n=1 Tax=Protopterus annectens TaxID=7888 RepID=UPI001CFB026B|nr:uncharacterized protein LOC122808648 isoform X2 [Protopterus annectens]
MGPAGLKLFKWTDDKGAIIVQIMRSGMIFYGSTIKKDRFKSADYSSGNYSLLMSQLEPHDSGQYTCSSSEADLNKVNLHVYLEPSPPEIHTPATERGNTVLPCSAELHNYVSFPWTFMSTSRATIEVRNGWILPGIYAGGEPEVIFGIVNQSSVLNFTFTNDTRPCPKTTYADLLSGKITFSHVKGGAQVELAFMNVTQSPLLWKETEGSHSTEFRFSLVVCPTYYMDAGWYTLTLNFTKGVLQKELRLITMKVTHYWSKVTTGTHVNLTCQVSNVLPFMSLTWFHIINSTQYNKVLDQTGVAELTVTFPNVTADPVGLWRCCLYVKTQKKVCADYNLEKTNHLSTGISVSLQKILLGGGTVTAGILCLIIIIFCIRRCRQSNETKFPYLENALKARRAPADYD